MSLVGDVLGYINSGRAGQAISDANIAAEHGVLGATGNAQTGIMNAVGNGQAGVNTAVSNAGDILGTGFTNAYGDVQSGATGANSTLQGVLDSINGGTQGFVDAGSQGLDQLKNSHFNFNLDDYFNSPAYKFQLQQGQDAINNSMSARGLSSSGNALKALTDYGQGLASTYYQQAFNNALSGYQANTQTAQQLVNAGEFGTQARNAASTAIGGQQAANTFNTGLFGGQQQMNMAQLLSELGLQGAEFNSGTGLTGATESGKLGMLGAEEAGNYAVNAGIAHAGGILGQGNALASGISDIGSLLMLL